MYDTKVRSGKTGEKVAMASNVMTVYEGNSIKRSIVKTFPERINHHATSL